MVRVRRGYRHEVRKVANIRRHRAWRRPRLAIKYLLFSHELDNYTYELANEAELAAVVGEALGVPASLIARYVDELQADDALRNEINRRLIGLGRNRTMPYGRRLGWYAVVRHVRPAVVVETGIHDGLGSTVLLRALDRNGTGRLISFDIREGVGSLVPDDLDRDGPSSSATRSRRSRRSRSRSTCSCMTATTGTRMRWPS